MRQHRRKGRLEQGGEVSAMNFRYYLTMFLSLGFVVFYVVCTFQVGFYLAITRVLGQTQRWAAYNKILKLTVLVSFNCQLHIP